MTVPIKAEHPMSIIDGVTSDIDEEQAFVLFQSRTAESREKEQLEQQVTQNTGAMSMLPPRAST